MHHELPFAPLCFSLLNACVINSKYRAFAGGLTEVAVTLTVTDMQAGRANLAAGEPRLLPRETRSVRARVK